jgi:hypothetical protein
MPPRVRCGGRVPIAIRVITWALNEEKKAGCDWEGWFILWGFSCLSLWQMRLSSANEPMALKKRRGARALQNLAVFWVRFLCLGPRNEVVHGEIKAR